MFKTRDFVLMALFLILALATCGLALESPKIDRKPAAVDWQRGKLAALPHYDPNSTKPFQVDLRSSDVSGLDLKDRLADLLSADFDDRTKWPAAARLPEGFDYKRIMELGKNPGLGIRELHRQGITGRGVGIAICDQPMIVDHQEYADRLRLYEEINIPADAASEMHGPAVASIAVGKTVGVAPEADLYYIGQLNGDVNVKNRSFTMNFEYLARGVQRILEINEQLPPDKKIRVISISAGWEPLQKGYKQITEAVDKAKAAGMLVICSSVEQVHGLAFDGLGRSALANPDDFDSYEPGSWWAASFYKGGDAFHGRSNQLHVPMDSRTTASPTGANEYAFYAEGGWSWSIPYIAGMYALAAQVEPKITPERFWALALKTGRTIKLHHRAKEIDFGPILDPRALIEAIRRGDLSDPAAVTAELAKKYTAQSAPIPTEPLSKEFAAKIDGLDLNKATRKDVIEQLGKPASYVLGDQQLDPNNLPDRYAMVYPAGVQVIIDQGRILRIAIFSSGYLFQGKIKVGSTLEEVFQVLGPPAKTIEQANGQEVATSQEDSAFYKDIGGVKGNCIYRARAKGVTVWLADNHVRALVLLPRK